MRALILALAVGAFAPDAFAADPTRSQILELMSGYEESASPDSLKALGASVPSLLEAIADDESLTHTQRARAIHALGWFPSDETRTFLTKEIRGSDSLFARKAAYALGNGWGDGAVPELSTALAHKDDQIRMAAATSLQNVGTTSARQALEARLAVEPDATVKTTIEKALGK